LLAGTVPRPGDDHGRVPKLSPGQRHDPVSTCIRLLYRGHALVPRIGNERTVQVTKRDHGTTKSISQFKATVHDVLALRSRQWVPAFVQLRLKPVFAEVAD